jgi:hypothetical protein
VRPRASIISAVLAALCVALVAAAPASARAPYWKLGTEVIPGHIEPGHEATITASALNLGDAPLQASAEHPVTLRDVLPSGMTVAAKLPSVCPVISTEPVCGHKWPESTLTVHQEPTCKTLSGSEVICEFEEPLAPYEEWQLAVNVNVASSVTFGSTTETNTVEVEQKGEHAVLPPKTYQRVLTVQGSPAEATPFGVEHYEFAPETETGELDRRAGAHPYEFTTTLGFNQILEEFRAKEHFPPEASVPSVTRNIAVNLPAGFIGDTRALPQCSELEFDTISGNGFSNVCPADTAVGVAVVDIQEPITIHNEVLVAPVYNLTPTRGEPGKSSGEPARFGFVAFKVPVTLDTVDNGGDGHVVVNVKDSSQVPAILSTTVAIWGTPGASIHDESRGWGCLTQGIHASPGEPCEPSSEANPGAFLTTPTQCEDPLTGPVEIESWKGLLGAGAPAALNTLSGCGELPFTPSMEVKPVETRASTPTGLHVLLKVPQNEIANPEARVQSDIRTTKVTLPAGMQLSPSAANGLESCSLANIGYTGRNATTGTLEFTPEEATAPEPCPAASKIGTVRVRTPLLTTRHTVEVDGKKLEDNIFGNVYLAAQEENPFPGSLFGLYVVIKDEETGVVAKLAGKVELDKETGQITNVFPDAPQLPFEEFELNVENGPRASLATPRSCGTYTTRAAFKPWSFVGAGEEEGLVGSSGEPSALEFGITSGAGGAACPGTEPFTPVVSAGSESTQAGAFSPFSLTLVREDGEQQPTGLTVSLPPGIAAILANVPRCAEAQANAGTCGPESLIGSATATSGLGPDPYTIHGGRVYLTEAYGGGQFGLSVVIPANAGGTPGHPVFHFGNVVTRSAIFVNPTTAAITIVSHLPTMVDTQEKGPIGVPVQLRRVTVTTDRQNFQFNPTNCSRMSVTGSVQGDQGASTSFSEPYQVTGCEKLAFSPTLEAEVESHWTKVEGTGLKVTVRATPGQANIQKTKIIFPAEMPSRLTTIQKACPEAVFAANPASCPEGSNIGTAIAHTPVLKNPLVGPAYLVSHGNAAFPDAEFVLQGEGVTLILDGQTDIKGPHGEPCAASKSGCITSSTFNTVPDAPVSTFEVDLPRGPHSAFTGYGELCHATKTVPTTKLVTKTVGRGKHRHKIKVRVKSTATVAESLTLPTVLGGQNGNTIEETLPLKVTGCQAVKASKTKKKPKKKKHKKHKKHKKK